MKENITYGECLSEILKALNLKSSRLAREINIDSSLIYKWLRNERVPSYDSPYIDLILNYLSRKAVNPPQRKALIEVLANYEIELYESNDTTLFSHLKSMLQNSQGYSIKLHNKIKSERKLTTTNISRVADFIKNMDAQSSVDDNNSFDGEDIQSLFKNRKLDSDNIKIARGTWEVLYAGISLLEQAPITPLTDDNTILITLNSDLHLLLTKKDLNSLWVQKLHELLSNGWKLIVHVTLDNNVNRTIRIIEDIQALLAIGNLTVYYCGKYSHGLAKDTELCIIPGTGALLSFSTYINNQIDSAFLFHSRNSIEILSIRFFQNLNFAKPLLKTYPSQKSTEFQQAFAESEETPGEKYVFKEGLSTITIPLNLYEKYLSLNSLTNQEFSYRTFLHKRRLDAFKEQVLHYNFRDICFIESIIDLVDHKQYSFDEKYLIQDHTPQNSNIICHLENLISLLETYGNYNIAFVSKARFGNMNNVNWMVKGNSSVLIETFNKNEIDYFNSKMNFSITENSVVSAFHDYFQILWDGIADEYKDKEKTIIWLRSLIKKCKELVE